MGSISSVTSKNKEILFKSVNLNYDDFKTDRLAWDYEKLMDAVGLSLDEIKKIQSEVYVGDTPLLELKNINRLVRSMSEPGKGARIFMKDEANNPTGSFKDRRASLAVYEAKKNGYPGVIAASSGNYGAAVASQASRRGINSIIIQEVYDDAYNGQPESLEKGRACEAYGAEIQQYTVGPEVFTYVILDLLDKTGYFSASLYLPHSIAGIETLGTEIFEQIIAQTGREPDVVLITHAGGGNFTGTARGLRKAGYKGKINGITVNLADLDSHDDSRFARKSFSTGHSGYGFPSLFNPESVDVPLNAARPLRYMDELYIITQGEVYYITEMLAQLEGLQRGPAGNTSLAGAFTLAREMDADQIIVVQESEYTGAGKQHTAQLTFAEDHGVIVRRGKPEEEVPGDSIIIPQNPSQIRAKLMDLDKFRIKYLEYNVKDKHFDNITTQELEFLALETNQTEENVGKMLRDMGLTVQF
ncbi:MAG TPA: 2-amino-4-oxopentanoate thiolase subunit OrtB [Clostridia bacterium]|nr:2-amino-4-oxopentanoate thiolase subunit OrtB [Clostridia bacterium]